MDKIYNDELTLEDALEEQKKFKKEIEKDKKSTKSKSVDKKRKRSLTFENTYRLLRGRQKVINSF